MAGSGVVKFPSLLDPQTGALERDIRLGKWHIPADLRIEGDSLVYSIGNDDTLVKSETPNLEAFVSLQKKAEILTYARKWGVLGLCRHGLPADHPDLALFSWARSTEGEGSIFFELMNRSPIQPTDKDVLMGRCLPVENDDGDWTERLDDWRWYANTTASFLAKAHALKTNDEPDHKSSISRWLDDWLTLAPATVTCDKFAKKFDIKLVPRSPISALCAALVLQALFAVNGAYTFLTCAECGRVYLPKRRPTRGPNTFCRTCGIKAARRAATRKFNAMNPGYYKQFRNSKKKENAK